MLFHKYLVNISLYSLFHFYAIIITQLYFALAEEIDSFVEDDYDSKLTQVKRKLSFMQYLIYYFFIYT